MTKPNVLMIWVDDLRPEFSAYGVDHVPTPNLDRLAQRGTRFDRAYCNIPVCGASRASVMTGMRGTPQRFVDYLAQASKQAPHAVPLHQHFRGHGYHTAFFGKVFHVTSDHADGWIEGDDCYDWPGYTRPENKEAFRPRTETNPRETRGPAWEVAVKPAEELADGKIAAATGEAIDRLAHGNQPFFIAAGFYKPHLPFVAPAPYWKASSPAPVLLPTNYKTRPQVPGLAFTNWGELRSYAGIPRRGPVTDLAAKRLIAGYHACVKFIDGRVGVLLDRLEASGVADETIIVLLGDHGWNLGEHGMWCKHSCFETSMRTALLISAPGDHYAKGSGTRSLAEFIDIYPTLCELAGITAPTQLQGKSLVPVLEDPEASVRDVAVGRYVHGDTIRSDRYRYTLYRRQGKEVGEMLYDHASDPDENRNLAENPEYADVVADLRDRLEESLSR